MRLKCSEREPESCSDGGDGVAQHFILLFCQKFTIYLIVRTAGFLMNERDVNVHKCMCK